MQDDKQFQMVPRNQNQNFRLLSKFEVSKLILANIPGGGGGGGGPSMYGKLMKLASYDLMLYASDWV